ncbi:MAG: hypothetical protein JST00_29825 [Deltaproteobacteria bacterium]|nr:hypothetical protein [Deltaproteobacteria bacterium]
MSGDVNVMALGDSGAAKPTKPKPPTKPKVCKDAGADASKKKECDPADLAEGCTCEKLEELYKLQKEMCANVRACSKGDFCTNIDDKMSNRRNCINLRRDVQLCYKKPDFGGHQEAIDTQCRGLQECADIWRTKKCGDDLPIVVPAACPQVK